MLDSELLQVTGRGTNINFTIDDQRAFSDVLSGLETYLSKNRHLLSKGNVTVNVGQRILNKSQLTKIKHALESGSGLHVAQFWCSPDVLSTDDPDDDSVTPMGVKSIQNSSHDPVSISTGPIDLKTATIEHEIPDDIENLLPSITGDIELDRDTYTEESGSEDLPIHTLRDIPNEIANADGPDIEAFSESGLTHSEVSHPGISPTKTSSNLVDLYSETTSDPGPLELALINLEHSIQRGIIDDSDLHNGISNEESDSFNTYNVGFPSSDETEQEPLSLNRQNEALLIKTTCRSGEVVHYAGDVVILADVNPGAEIIADGDIVVFGNLRGFAHAGAAGDLQATIIALDLDTSRVQIGPYVGISPKISGKRRSRRAEASIAYIRRQHIFVSPFKGRYAKYSGGTLYDG
ncbi:MAG: septum site-determining protein MinC [Chloroflexota bacterium]|nr:septum site-determining protein MinC [Chloroflexota bacterium]